MEDVHVTYDNRACRHNHLQLAEAGVTDFDRYKVDPDSELMGDFFID